MNRSQHRADIDVLPSWTLTTTAIWCEDVNQRAILIVKGDWSAYCVLLREYEARRMDLAGCRGEACRYLQDYRARLIAETRSCEADVFADSSNA